ncbi:MAG: 50S ribosomal protein L24 [Patescibacteria group bacterium]
MMKIKKGDTVEVLTGKDRGKRGVVERVVTNTDRVVVTGVGVATRHRKPVRGVKQAGRISINLPIHVSNVALVDTKLGKPTRVGFRSLADGTRERISRKSGEVI